ncbi:MAG: DNA-binding protein WhiA [Clostridia bacterium]|nr:DNA-binding protein WhiA [Clostridia bacterium]
MSFSSEVKEELVKKTDSARHCQIAEFAAFMGMSGNVSETDDARVCIEFVTENELTVEKFYELLFKIFGIKEDSDTNIQLRSGKETIIRITAQEDVAKILMTLKWCDDQFTQIEPVFADQRIVRMDCCKKAFIRGAFMERGSISDPNKFYHYEIVCKYEEDAEVLKGMLMFFGMDAKVIARKNSFIVYMKEGNNITDTLNLMGAVVSQMNLYNVMILKGISNDVNRKVNCETANLNKTIEAAVKQIKDIEYIRDTVGLDSLSDGLMQVALLRLENPDMNLKDLGELLDPPVGKSGVNHRLRKIGEKADELRESYGVKSN